MVSSRTWTFRRLVTLWWKNIKLRVCFECCDTVQYDWDSLCSYKNISFFLAFSRNYFRRENIALWSFHVALQSTLWVFSHLVQQTVGFIGNLIMKCRRVFGGTGHFQLRQSHHSFAGIFTRLLLHHRSRRHHRDSHLCGAPHLRQDHLHGPECAVRSPPAALSRPRVPHRLQTVIRLVMGPHRHGDRVQTVLPRLVVRHGGLWADARWRSQRGFYRGKLRIDLLVKQAVEKWLTRATWQACTFLEKVPMVKYSISIDFMYLHFFVAKILVHYSFVILCLGHIEISEDFPSFTPLLVHIHIFLPQKCGQCPCW